MVFPVPYSKNFIPPAFFTGSSSTEAISVDPVLLSFARTGNGLPDEEMITAEQRTVDMSFDVSFLMRFPLLR